MNPARLASLFAVALLAACGGLPIQHEDGSSSVRSFSFRDLLKSDVDNVAEIHQQEVLRVLKALTLRLYRSNPAEWRKSGVASAEEGTAALFSPLPYWHLSPQRNLDWEAALRDAWREDYPGDRVKALMGGLLVMHMAAFNHQTEFYLLTELDAQKLYHAARNTEAVAWKLAATRNAQGEPLLVADGSGESGTANFSFERECGKLVGIQDTLAKVIEDKTKRTIRFGVVNFASMIFLPI